MNPRFSRTLWAATFLLAAGLCFAGDDHDWNQWRGPDRDGAVGGTEWPEGLDGLERQWRIELGKGYPGPIVAGDRVFFVDSATAETVAVRALDRDSGNELWKTEWPGSGKVPFFAAANGDWVRSTPAFDGKTLFVGDMQEVLVALDGDTGEVRWKVDVPARFGTGVPDFGFASSPLLDGDHVYVQAANSLVKLSKKDGSTTWRALESSDEIQASGAFSSPIFATLHGVRQLVVQTRHTLFGVDPESGRELWKQPVPSFRGMNILTPAIHGDAIFTSPYRQKSFLYTVQKNGDDWSVGETWTNPATAYMSSPVVIDGHAYVHLGNGRVDCIELATGESKWRSESFGKYWSMTFQGDKILALSENGSLYLMRADPAGFALLDQRDVSDQESWGYLAVSGDQVFVRELEAIAAYRWAPAASGGGAPAKASPTPAAPTR
jgi:outer membrane protein assembly factor BamB